MKFSPLNWNEVTPNEIHEAEKGRLRLLCSAQAPLYISAQGVEALAGVSTSFDFEVSEAVTYFLDAPEGVRFFVHVGENTVFEPDGEVYTNIDRMVTESGTVLEIRKAMRQFELEKRSLLKQIRIDAARSARSSVSPLSSSEPVTAEPTAEPVEETME